MKQQVLPPCWSRSLWVGLAGWCLASCTGCHDTSRPVADEVADTVAVAGRQDAGETVTTKTLIGQSEPEVSPAGAETVRHRRRPLRQPAVVEEPKVCADTACPCPVVPQPLTAVSAYLPLTATPGPLPVVASSTVVPPVKAASRKVERISRDIKKATFIPKGQWMAGGTVSYSEHDEGNLNFLVLKDVEGRGYTFSVSPYVGYFFRNNCAAGVRFTYNRTYLDMKNFDLSLGEDFNISLDNLYWLEHKYEVGGCLRTYMPIGSGNIFGLFNEVRLTYGYSAGKNSTGSGTEYDGTFEKSHNLQIGFAPGLTAFVTNWMAVEVSVGVMGYNFKWTDQVSNQIETGKRRTSSGNFKINLFSINIGMTFYL